MSTTACVACVGEPATHGDWVDGEGEGFPREGVGHAPVAARVSVHGRHVEQQQRTDRLLRQKQGVGRGQEDGGMVVGVCDDHRDGGGVETGGHACRRGR